MEEKALVIRNDKGQIVPGSAPVPGVGRPKGGTNAIRSWMKNQYAEYCATNGDEANILLFYAKTYMDEDLDIKIRLEAAKALDRIIFPNHSLVTAEKGPVDDAMTVRAKKLAAAFGVAFMEGLPKQIEAGPR